jgi:hypothetical protein
MSIRPTLWSLALIVVSACGDAAIEFAPVSDDDRSTLEAALRRAIADSAALARAAIDVPVVLETAFTEDDSSVAVTERFRLRKQPHAEFAAVDRTQRITGARSLLSSMYSFENSRGELRAESEARFSSVGFGADQRGILRGILERRLGLVAPLHDSATSDARGARIVRFHGEGVSGTLVLDRSSLTARSVTMLNEQSSLIGGYRYEINVALAEPDDALRMPVSMITTFEFERLTSEGNGTVRMLIDSAHRR